ncbi:hypothetical protein BGZ50_008649 [Haplosporangium sp. Z 11]|nr:hypothetical protein BGZ50_008649 [Haplosporangium sp. Z 11]
MAKADAPQRVSFGTFSSLGGYNIAKSTMHAIYKRKEEYRTLAKDLSENTYYVLKRKQMNVEKVMVRRLQDQRARQNPVTKEMITEAAKTTYTILADLR